jgi:uncharacterized protein
MDSIVHFEIPVDNTDEAKKFYEQAFGWQIRQDKMPDGSTYTSAVTTETENSMPKKPGAINGAIIERDDTLKVPLVTVGVDSIDESIKKVEAAGGKVVVPKAEVPNIGEYAYVADPAGNIVGLWHDAQK